MMKGRLSKLLNQFLSRKLLLDVGGGVKVYRHEVCLSHRILERGRVVFRVRVMWGVTRVL